ncbi:MAG: YXWGXW repeat-containing protein [Bacteroidota bacterium]|nr:YXWGXW repeat-containing protein [Bacteroidota bacterium]
MKSFLMLGLFSGMLLAATPAFSQVFIGFGIRVGPPPPRHEVVVVRPYPDAVWVPGYYRWRHHRYVWIHGYWIRRPHPYVVWVPARWECRNGEWVFFEGRWNNENLHQQEHRPPGRMRNEGSRR